MFSVKERATSNLIEKTLFKNIFSNLFSDSYSIKFWDGEEITYGTGDSCFRIILNESLPISDIITDPSVTFGEAYMQKNLILRAIFKM